MLLGHTCICAVEIEGYCRKVLLQRQRDGILPRFPIWDNIQTFDGRPWKGRVDVVCGGFPYQDISAAGKGAGIKGQRSGLWGEMARVIREIQPKYVFVENSPLLVGRGLAVVLGDLAEMGFDARWCVLGADDAGAPHKRKRIWLLAHTNSCGGVKDTSTSQLRADLLKQSPTNQRESHSPEDAEKWWVSDPADLPDTDKMRLQGRSKKQGSRDSKLQQVELVRSDRERQKNKGTETFEPYVGRVANGVAFRVDRLKAIGNGQVPHVAALAWQILIENKLSSSSTDAGED